MKLFNRFLICVILVFLCSGCLELTWKSSTEVPQAQIQKLNEQIKSEQYRQIYKDSAPTLQAEVSEDLFVNRISEAARKMKEVDETLNFQKSELSEVLSPLLNHEFWTNNYQKVENNNKKIEFLTQWVKEQEDSSFKLRSLSLFEPTDSGKYLIYSVEQGTVSTK